MVLLLSTGQAHSDVQHQRDFIDTREYVLQRAITYGALQAICNIPMVFHFDSTVDFPIGAQVIMLPRDDTMNIRLRV
jgi:hypothetical protein